MRIVEPTEEHRRAWQAWVASRPAAVRAIAERLDPWSLYRMKSSGHRVTLVAINENGTVRVNVSGDFNLVLHERSVVGVEPDDLEPCDLPGPGETLGSLLSAEEIDQNIDVLRVLVRPDLFVLDENGKAIRKMET